MHSSNYATWFCVRAVGVIGSSTFTCTECPTHFGCTARGSYFYVEAGCKSLLILKQMRISVNVLYINMSRQHKTSNYIFVLLLSQFNPPNLLLQKHSPFMQVPSFWHSEFCAHAECIEKRIKLNVIQIWGSKQFKYWLVFKEIDDWCYLIL